MASEHHPDYIERAKGVIRGGSTARAEALIAIAIDQRRIADALEQIMAYLFIRDLDVSIKSAVETARESDNEQ